MTDAPVQYTVPPLIKRNLALFSASQTFTGAGMQFAYFLGPLMVVALTGSAGLAGVSVGIIALSRFIIAYPMGKITDRYGRKIGVFLGLVVALVGSLMIGFSLNWRSITLLITGMLVLSMGMNAGQQMRVAATDMFPPSMRAQALGWLALGALGGLAAAPIIVNSTEGYAKAHGWDPMALPWFAIPFLIMIGLCFLHFVRPDPMEIGKNLAAYYPGYKEIRRGGGPPPPFSARDMWGNWLARYAMVSNCAGQGNMSIVMVLTSLVLQHHGHSLSEISISHMCHSAGMFAFTIPLGRLADRYGRREVMFPGVIVTILGAIFVTFTPTYYLVTLGAFLVGIGWAATNVAATALIADQYETAQRGRAIGVNDSFAAGISVFAALITGPLIDYLSLPAAGIAAIVMALPPLFMVAGHRMSSRAAAARAAE